MKNILRLGAFLSLVVSIQAAVAPTQLLNDPTGISDFELYGNGIYWWSTHGVCGTEFPHTARIRVRPTLNSATKQLANDCSVLTGFHDNVVRDDAYAYFFSNGQLVRKALNALATDPVQILNTQGFSPTLPASQLGAVLLLDKGTLYWGRYVSGNVDIYSMPTDASTAPHYVGTLIAGDEIQKMQKFRLPDGAGDIDGLVVLCANGKLFRYKFNASGTLNLVATGVSDFAIHSSFGLPGTHVSSTIFAAVGQTGVVSQNAAPGKLLNINPVTGASTVVYTAQGNNQLVGVATDSDSSIFELSGTTKNVYVSEGIVTCGNLFCSVGDVAIHRHTLPASSTTGWDQILTTGGGYGLRSDDKHLFFVLNDVIKTLPTDAPAQVLNIKADALEVVQTIQDLDTSVTLVANRPTFVRGYAHLTANTTGKNVWFPTAQLRGFLNGVELPGSPIQPINTTSVDSTNDIGSVRSDLKHSFLFQMPDDWVKPGPLPFANLLTFSMTVNEQQAISETGSNPYADNTIGLKNPAVLVEKGWPCIVTVPMLTAYAPTYYANGPGWPMILERARTLLPIEDLSVFTFAATEPMGDPDEPYKIGDSDDDTNDDAQSDALDDLDDIDLESDPCDDKDAHYMGMVHPSNPGFNGVSRRDTDLLIVRMETNAVSGLVFGGGKSMAHEMGHDYGRRHIACGNFPDSQKDFDPSLFPCTLGNPLRGLSSATFGFDYITFNVIPPDTAADLMSYAGNRWTSKDLWQALLGVTAAAPPPPAPAPPMLAELPPPPTGQVILVRGRVDEENQVGFFRTFCAMPEASAPAKRVAASRVLAARLATQPDNYFLRQLGAAGQLLSDTAVALHEGANHERHLKWETFQQYVDFQPGTRVLQLVHGGAVIAERFVSSALPAVQMGPVTLDPAAQTLSLRWSATDADGDPLRFSVQYSADNGVTWRSLRSGWKIPSLTLSTRMLPGTTRARIRVTATDGVNCAMAISPAFVIEKHAPEVQMEGVAEGERIPYDSTRILRGAAMDAESPSRTVQLKWALTGPVSMSSTGVVFTLRDLSPGAYTAALTATDPDGQSSTVTRHFEVLPLVIPEGPAPVLDGFVNDTAYGDATLVKIPLGAGQFARAHLVHSGNALYVGFSNLKYATVLSLSNRRAGLRIDPNASGDRVAQLGDIGFFVDEDGIPSQEVAARGAMVATLSPKPGFSAVIQRGLSGWSAEMRIDDSLIGGWNHLAGIMLDHDTPHWPAPATDSAPFTWAPAYFGIVPPRPSNRAPIGNAGIAQTYSPRADRVVFLDGSASHDPDGDALNYSWKQISGPTVVLTNPKAAIASFTARPVKSTTSYVFQLTVNDGTVDGAPVQVQVTLEPAPFLPTSVATSGFAGLSPDGQLRLRLAGQPKQSYRIEFSEDLQQWTTLKTVYSDYSGRIDVSQLLDLKSHKHLFFRGVSQ